MKKKVLLLVCFFKVVSCGLPVDDSAKFLTKLKSIESVPIINDTLLIGKANKIIYQYVDTLDTNGYSFGAHIYSTNVKSEYVLPPVVDSCYWMGLRCKDNSRARFIEEVNSVLCSLWMENKLYSVFFRLGIPETNIPKSMHFRDCFSQYSDVSEHISDELDQIIYNWCIHSEGNCYFIIVTKAPLGKRSCDNIVIKSAYMLNNNTY